VISSLKVKAVNGKKIRGKNYCIIARKRNEAEKMQKSSKFKVHCLVNLTVLW